MAVRQHLFTGLIPPAAAPTGVGDHYVDTVAGNLYLSIGTATAADWILLARKSEVTTVQNNLNTEILTRDPVQHVRQFEDWNTPDAKGVLNWFVELASNLGAAAYTLSTDIDATANGILVLETGLDPNDGVAVEDREGAGGSYVMAGKTIVSEFRISLDQLASDFICWIGHPRAPFGTGNGHRFEYNSLSLNWQCVSFNGGLSTIVDSGVPVVATTWVKLKMIATDSQVLYYIDGVLVATITTNISVNSLGTKILLFNVGTPAASRSMRVDYLNFEMIFTTPR